MYIYIYINCIERMRMVNIMSQVNINVGVDIDTLQSLDAFCEKTNRKRNQVIRSAIRVYIGDDENLNKKWLPKRWEEAQG